MNGDSFIYLDKRFVNYLYDNSLSNDPLLKISDWLGGSKTDYAFDRTNTIQGPLREKNISPIPEFDINFNKTFKEICEDTARDIINEGKSIDIYWSGGVDSTAVVVAFLNVCTDFKQLNIVYDTGGIEEYPLFYEKYVKDITEKPINRWIYHDVNLDDNIIVSGHPAGFIIQSSGQGRSSFGQDGYKGALTGFKESDYKTMPWRDVFLDEDFIENITPQIDNSPIEIKSIADLRWWLNFSMKWQSENMTPLRFLEKLNYDKMKNCKAFFSTDDFQKWSMWNYDKNLRDVLPPYKIDFKEIIYDLVKDEDYYINKKKEFSARRLSNLRNLNKKRVFKGVDDQYNIIDDHQNREAILEQYGNPNYVYI
jgi:hypothetical protein